MGRRRPGRGADRWRRLFRIRYREGRVRLASAEGHACGRGGRTPRGTLHHLAQLLRPCRARTRREGADPWWHQRRGNDRDPASERPRPPGSRHLRFGGEDGGRTRAGRRRSLRLPIRLRGRSDRGDRWTRRRCGARHVGRAAHRGESSGARAGRAHSPPVAGRWSRFRGAASRDYGEGSADHRLAASAAAGARKRRSPRACAKSPGRSSQPVGCGRSSTPCCRSPARRGPTR